MSFFFSKQNQTTLHKNEIIQQSLIQSVQKKLTHLISQGAHFIFLIDDNHIFIVFNGDKDKMIIRKFNMKQEAWDKIIINDGITIQLNDILNFHDQHNIHCKIFEQINQIMILYIINSNEKGCLIKLVIDVSNNDNKKLVSISTKDIQHQDHFFVNIHLMKQINNNILYGLAFQIPNLGLTFFKYNEKNLKFIKHHEYPVSNDNQLLNMQNRAQTGWASVTPATYRTTLLSTHTKKYLYCLLWYDINMIQLIKMDTNEDVDDQQKISADIIKIPTYTQNELIKLTHKSGKTVYDHTIYARVCFFISELIIVCFDMDSEFIHLYNIQTKEMKRSLNTQLLKKFNQKGKSDLSVAYRVNVLRDPQKEQLLIAGFIRQQNKDAQHSVPFAIQQLISNIFYINQIIQLLILRRQDVKCWNFNADILFNDIDSDIVLL